MNTIHKVAVLLLGACCFGGGPPSLPSPSSSGWGPSWVGGAPPGGNIRPKKIDKCLTVVTIADDRSVIGVSIRLWADADVQKGHEYQLMYQLRLHTLKGEAGPILGTDVKPGGVACVVASATADDAWNGLEGIADVNRKDITGMTNLPSGETVTLRFEPQLYDKVDDKFVSSYKTQAILLIATVSQRGRVESVVPLRVWISANSLEHAEEVLTTLTGLDEYDQDGNGIGEAIAAVLGRRDLPTPIKVRFIQAVGKETVHPKAPGLWQVLNDFAAGNDEDLKKAAKARLKEAYRGR